MKRQIESVVTVPDGFQVEIHKSHVVVKHNGKEIKKIFVLPNVEMKKEDNAVRIFTDRGTKREGKVIGSAAAHLQNMFNGLKEDFVYKLEICNVHFPMTIKVEGNKFVIKNFLGETIDRVAEILPGVKVDVKGNIVSVSSSSRDEAGQTAANIEKATLIRLKDRRIFQDGIFITDKPGRKI